MKTSDIHKILSIFHLTILFTIIKTKEDISSNGIKNQPAFKITGLLKYDALQTEVNELNRYITYRSKKMNSHYEQALKNIYLMIMYDGRHDQKFHTSIEFLLNVFVRKYININESGLPTHKSYKVKKENNMAESLCFSKMFKQFFDFKQNDKRKTDSDGNEVIKGKVNNRKTDSTYNKNKPNGLIRISRNSNTDTSVFRYTFVDNCCRTIEDYKITKKIFSFVFSKEKCKNNIILLSLKQEETYNTEIKEKIAEFFLHLNMELVLKNIKIILNTLQQHEECKIVKANEINFLFKDRYFFVNYCSFQTTMCGYLSNCNLMWNYSTDYKIDILDQPGQFDYSLINQKSKLIYETNTYNINKLISIRHHGSVENFIIYEYIDNKNRLNKNLITIFYVLAHKQILYTKVVLSFKFSVAMTKNGIKLVRIKNLELMKTFFKRIRALLNH